MNIENSAETPLPNLRRTYLLTICIVLIGVLTSALGLMVIAGWYTHDTKLIQVLPTLVPMQYNTALGFVLSGIGLIAIAFNRYRLALILSALLGSIAILTIVQYTFGVNLGLDELFMDHYITTKSSHPGRMAPTTAFSFLLTSTVLLVPSVRIISAQRFVILGFLFSLLFALGTGTLFVYLSGFDKPTPFGFTASTYMAVHTALGFAMLGAGVFLYIMRESFVRQDSQRWIPATVFFAVLWFTLGLWNALKLQEIHGVEQALIRSASNAEILYRDEIESYAKPLIRMASRWKSHDIMSKEEWQFDAKVHLHTDTTFMAIAWIDPSFHVRWIESREDITFPQNITPGSQEDLRHAMESAKKNNTVRAMYRNGLAKDGGGLMLFAPIYLKDKFWGWVIYQINLQERLGHLWGSVDKPNFTYEFYGGNDIVYASDLARKQTYEKFAIEKDFELYGESWRIRMFPTSVLLSSFQSPFPYIVLIFGTLVAVLLSLTMLLYQKSGIHAKEIEDTNTKLVGEIERRRETEERLRMVIENSPDSMIISNKEGKIVLINAQTENLFGYSTGEILGRTIETLLPKSLREDHVKHRENYHSHPVIRPMGQGLNLYGARKDGTLFPIEISLSPLETEEGTLALATIRDITERKKHDDLLRESEERFRSAFANSAIGMALVSPEGKWMKVNDALCNMVGYSEKELLATNFRTITHPDDLEADLNRVREMLNGKITVYDVEKRYIHKQGQTVWILLNVSLVYDAEGTPLYFISQIQDITQRKKTEEALNDTLAQLSKKSQYESVISDVTRSVHSSIKLENVLENAVQSIHKNLTAAGGVAIYLVGENIAKIKAHTGFPDWFIDQVREIPSPKGYTWKAIIEGKQVYCDDVDRDNAIGPAGRKLGTRSYVSTPIRQDGKAIGCININCQRKNAFNSDDLKMHEIIARQIEVAIDHAKQAKEMKDAHENLRTTTQMLIQAEKMGAVGTMVAGVAHELNNPLMGVLNSIEISLKHTSEDDKRYKYLSIGHEATKRCIDIVANLLTFSYHDDSTDPLFKKECCRTILSSVLELINYRIVKHNINIIQDIDDGDLGVWMKANSMKQVFLNLISNAIDASENCERKEIRIGMKQDDNHVKIVIEDKGDGMPPEKLGRIFDPFFTTKPVGKGTGLGLSITRNIINEHNGEIACDSQVGKGTKFTILLPIDRRVMHEQANFSDRR